jgi:hypothetical protein
VEEPPTNEERLQTAYMLALKKHQPLSKVLYPHKQAEEVLAPAGC